MLIWEKFIVTFLFSPGKTFGTFRSVANLSDLKLPDASSQRPEEKLLKQEAGNAERTAALIRQDSRTDVVPTRTCGRTCPAFTSGCRDRSHRADLCSDRAPE